VTTSHRVDDPPEPLAPPAQGGAPPRVRRWPSARRVLCGLAVAFFFVPAVAAALGVRATGFENKRLVGFPSFSDGWRFFPELSTWAIDHLPLRNDAVRADTAISQHVFGEPPTFGENSAGLPIGNQPGASAVQVSRVVVGRDSWLFFNDDFSYACQPLASFAQTRAAADRLAGLITGTGARYAMFVGPDKSFMEPQYLPGSFPLKNCGPPAQRAFWAELAASPPAGYVDLRGPLLAAQARAGVPIYRLRDTHWTAVGEAVYAERLAATVDPQLLNDTTLRDVGPVSPIGDLTRLLGVPQTNTYDNWVVDRPGVAAGAVQRRLVDGLPVAEYRSSSTGAALYPAPVLIIADSYTREAILQVEPFWSDLLIVDNQTAAAHPAGLAQLIRGSRVVILEAVERSYANGYLKLLAPSALDALARDLGPGAGGS